MRARAARGACHLRWLLALLSCSLGATFAACGRVDSLEACDVLKDECQRDAYFAVVRMRGDGFDAFGGIPPIRTITVEEYRKSLEADPPTVDEPDDEVDKGDKGDEGDTDEDSDKQDKRSPRSRAFDTALTLLGLLSPATTSSQASVEDAVGNVVAYYSGATGEVTVIDRGGERNFDRETTTLVHELVHAFQAREPPISFSDGTIDDSFARRGLIEGEAELYEQLAGAEIDEAAPTTLEWDDYYDNWIGRSRRNLGKARQPYFSVSRGFGYPLGGYRLVQTWLSGGNAAVRSLFAERPQTSQFFMAPQGDRAQRLPVPTACAAEPPDDDMEAMLLERFGAAQLYAFLTKAYDDEDDLAWEQALAWRGDAMRIYGDEDAQRVALTWRILLEDAEHAEALRDKLVTLELENLEPNAIGAHLVIHAASEGELLDGWLDGFDCDAD